MPACVPPNETGLRVLFLGNSLTYYNDMPAIFRELALSAGKKIYVDSVTKGAATVAQFADRNTEIGASAYGKLTGEKWNAVIIEPSRRITPDEDTVMGAELSAAAVIADLAKKAGASLMLYTVWGNNNGVMKIYEMTGVSSSKKITSREITHREHTRIMYDANVKVSDFLGGVPMVNAGLAFENVMIAHPEIDLYYTDLRHPSLAGSYLAACCFYAAIYGEKTVPLTYTAGLPDDAAATLREDADETVLKGLLPDGITLG